MSKFIHHLKCSQNYARYWSSNIIAPKNKFKTEDTVTILQKTNNLFSFYSWSVKAQETIASNMKWLSDDAKQHIKAGKDVLEQD